LKLSDIQTNLVGEWAGNNLLRLSWQAPSDFNSTGRMFIQSVGNGKFLTFRYSWSHEGTAHEGAILLAHAASTGIATAGWVDSWHQSGGVLCCEGSLQEDGTIQVKGYYAAPPGPDWGWRITIAQRSDNELQMVMHNCAPDGKEDLAVQADYTRIS
jgi:hypothetical protein